MLSNLFNCKTMQPVTMSDKILKCDKRNSYRVSISMMLLKLFVYYYRLEEITCHCNSRKNSYLRQEGRKKFLP